MTCIANATTELDKHEEIEITEEMVEAGAYALAEYDRKFESLEEAATRVFIAMKKAARRTVREA
jgi:hypothetical protein